MIIYVLSFLKIDVEDIVSITINADVNGGYNIGKKAIPNAFSAEGIEGVGLHPY